MSHAGSYAEWQESAAEHDRLSGAADWREDDQCEWIHASELRASIARLRRMRRRGETWTLMNAFQDALFRHQGECAQPELYQVARAGTKRVIGEYLEELETCFAYLLDLQAPGVDDAYRLAQVKRVGRVYGRPALMLSGGALLGLFHFGVVKALFERRRARCRIEHGIDHRGLDLRAPDEELRELFADPSRINREAWAACRLARCGTRRPCWTRTNCVASCHGARGSNVLRRDAALAAHPQHHGLAASQATDSASAQLPVRPNALVNSAVLASCAIPVAFKPVQLLSRRRGRVEPWMKNERWIDGSVHSDLPFEAARCRVCFSCIRHDWTSHRS